MHTYFKLMRFIKPHAVIFILAIICMIISTIFNCVSLGMIVPLSDRVLRDGQIIVKNNLPLQIQQFIDILNAIPQLRLLNILAGSILVVFILKGLTLFLQSYLMNDVSQRVIRDIRNVLYRKVHSLSMDYFAQTHTGQLVSRITFDVTIIQDSMAQGIADLIYQSLQVAAFAIMVFFIHWQMAAVAVLIIPIVILPIVKIGRKIRKISTNAQEKMAQINKTLYETISGARIVKAFSMEEKEIKKFESQNRDFYKMIMRIYKRAVALSPFTEFVGVCGGVFVLYYGGREVIKNNLSFGIFILFLGTLLSLVRPIKRLSAVNVINQQAIAAGTRIFELLETTPTVKEDRHAVILPIIKRQIVFKNVYSGYDDRDVLKGINLKVNKGEIIAIVGPSGVGKTTLVNLIPRFYDPTQGQIFIDEYDIKQVTFRSLREQIGIVTQDIILFNDTVRENIAYGSLNAAPNEIINAAKIANAHQFIIEIRDGYDAIIGDQGIKLSGGQRQRLAIARAVVKNPPILILDEATSQLDTESECLVQQALDRLMEHRTVFVIAHRLTTVRRADKIVVIDEGKISAMGTHAQLMGISPLYKKLYDMQFVEL
ncbi:MAG: ABC transporter ATP-binding protein [Candidatus Omnitrophota bacterium]